MAQNATSAALAEARQLLADSEPRLAACRSMCPRVPQRSLADEREHCLGRADSYAEEAETLIARAKDTADLDKRFDRLVEAGEWLEKAREQLRRWV